MRYSGGVGGCLQQHTMIWPAHTLVQYRTQSTSDKSRTHDKLHTRNKSLTYRKQTPCAYRYAYSLCVNTGARDRQVQLGQCQVGKLQRGHDVIVAA